jgi:fibronectin type 3 domain-containing protein
LNMKKVTYILSIILVTLIFIPKQADAHNTAGWTQISADSGTITRGGGWSGPVYNANYAYGVRMYSASYTNRYLEWTNNATDFILTYQKASNGGNGEVFVDGVHYGWIDYYSATVIEDNHYRISGLTPGNHTIRLLANNVTSQSSGTTVSLNGYEFNTAPAPTPAPTPTPTPVPTPTPIPDTTPPSDVTGFETHGVTDTEVRYSFTTPNDADFNTWHLYVNGVLKLTGSPPWAKGNFFQQTDYNLKPSTNYTYKLTTVDFAGNESAGVTQTFRTLDPDITPPAIPTGLTGTAGNAAITLNWAANTEPDIQGYNVYQGSTKVNGSPITTTNYIFSAINGTPYTLRITAVDKKGNESAQSAPITLTPINTTPPAAPLNVGASSRDSRVILSWNPNKEPDIQGYNVYQGSTKVNGSPIAGTYYEVAAGLTNGTSYSFSVTAVNTSGYESLKSAPISETPRNLTPPATPAGFTGTAGINQANLKWAANPEIDINGYNLYNGGTKVNTSPIKALSYTVTGLNNAQKYTFTLIAVNTSGIGSAAGATAEVTPLNSIPPAIPTGLTATAGSTKVMLNWTANGESDLQGYNIYYNTTKLNTSPITGTKQTITGLNNGQTYTFTITAVNNSFYESNKSAAVSAMPIPPPAIPEGLKAIAGDSKVSLSWTANTESNLKGYFIYMDGVKINTTPYKVTSFDVASGLTNGVTYHFSLQSIDTDGYVSAISEAVEATPRDTTPPAIPTGLKGQGLISAAALSWDPNTESDLQGYNVYQGSTKVNGSPITPTNYNASSLTNGTAYDFTITAVDLLGNESAKSALIKVTPVNVPVPTGLKAKATTTEVTLSWDPPTQPTTYIIYRDGVQVATAATPKYIDTTVISGKNYSYDVVAVDEANKQSEKANVRTYFSKNSTDYDKNGAVFSPADLIKAAQSFLLHYAGFILLAAVLIFSKPLTKLAIKLIKFVKIRFDDEDPDLTKNKVKRPVIAKVERVKVERVERVKTEPVNEVKPKGKGFNWAVFFGLEKPAKRQRKGRSKSSSLKQKAISEQRTKEKALKAEIREKDRQLKKAAKEKERIFRVKAKQYNRGLHDHILKRRRESEGKPEPTETTRAKIYRPSYKGTSRTKRS